MRFSDLDEVPLAALEAAAAPAAVLGTLVVVALGGLLATAVGLGAEGVGAGETVAAVVVDLVAVLTLLTLLAAAGVAVEGYRRRFERTDGGTHLLVGLFGPALAVALALGYAAFGSGGIGSAPWWALGVAAVGAHAVAFRTVAMYSMPEARRRRGSAVGAVAALPAVLALSVGLTERFLGGAVAVAGDRLAAGLGATGLPHSELAVVAVPLVVAVGYAVYRTRTAPAGSSAPARTSLPRSPTLPQPSRVPDASLQGAAGYVQERVVDVVPALRGSDSANASTGANGGTGPQRPPVSATSSGGRSGGSRSGGGSGSKRSRSGGSASSGGSSGGSSRSRSGSASARSSGGSSSGPSSSASSGSSGGSSGGGSSSDGGRSSRGVRKIGGKSGRGSSADGGSSAGAGGSDAGSGSSSGGGDADGESSGSDTRIFTGDFGSYGDDDTVDVCPACDETIPSDGVYRFCPFCGEQL